MLVVAYGLHRMIGWARGAGQEPHDAMQIGMIAVLLLAYSVLIAAPYVPGVELGLTMMAVEGPWIAPLIYVATVAGLALSFCLGHWLPYRWLQRMLEDLHLRRARELLEIIRPLDREARLALLETQALPRVGPVVARLRYLLVAALVNLPGNSVFGGGGGVCLLAGLSRLFHPVAMILTIALAVAPVPLAVWLFGFDPFN